MSLEETPMSCPLPPEIFDLIIDHLHDDATTLRTCCFVSKSWVPRTQQHLFAYIKFTNEASLESWMRAFPDPSNSPAHRVRTLSIRGIEVFARVNADACVWLRSFNNLEALFVNPTIWDNTQGITLVPLHGLSPTLKSLHIFCSSIPLPDIFRLICSFPHLEDLLVASVGTRSYAHNWDMPRTSPKLTGSLHLTGVNRSLSRGLLDFPDGLHFSKILVRCSIEDAGCAMNLVTRCSQTLESLTIEYYPSGDSWIPFLDLSRATKLKGVRFDWNRRSVQWIIAALQTVQSQDLQQITFYASCGPLESTISEWWDLDRLLDHLWTSRSIFPKILLGDGVRRAQDFFPGLTGRGVIGKAKN